MLPGPGRAAPYPGDVTPHLDARRRRSWEEDGWRILERAVPGDLLAAAQTAAARLFPTAEAMAAADSAGGAAVAGPNTGLIG